MLNQKKLDIKLMEHVVAEEGTNNGWEYRKWNNGKYEAWYKTTLSIARNTSYGSLYRSGVQTVDLPSFNNDILSVTGSCIGGEWLAFDNIGRTSLGYVLLRVSSATAESRTVTINIVGEWT